MPSLGIGLIAGLCLHGQTTVEQHKNTLKARRQSKNAKWHPPDEQQPTPVLLWQPFPICHNPNPRNREDDGVWLGKMAKPTHPPVNTAPCLPMGNGPVLFNGLECLQKMVWGTSMQNAQHNVGPFRLLL